MSIGKLFLGVGVVAMLVPGLASAELVKEQQICINKMNKDGVKVQAAQLKVNDGCVKDEVKKGPVGFADGCIDADPKGKVAKKRAKTVSDDGKKCGNTPAVFYSGPAVTNDAAEDTSKALLRDIFGPTLGALQNCDTNPEECLCQRKVINRVSKLTRAISKIWLKCKKAAMKNGKEPFTSGGAEVPAQLEQCITTHPLNGGLSVESDTKGKILKARDQLDATADQFCGLGTDDEFDPGECSGFSTPPGGADGNGLANCLRDLAKCRVCEMVNATDDLAIDCDAWVGITCP